MLFVNILSLVMHIIFVAYIIQYVLSEPDMLHSAYWEWLFTLCALVTGHIWAPHQCFFPSDQPSRQLLRPARQSWVKIGHLEGSWSPCRAINTAMYSNVTRNSITFYDQGESPIHHLRPMQREHRCHHHYLGGFLGQQRLAEHIGNNLS